MGLLDDTTHQQYYQGNDYGNYQFISLQDIITQFQIAYVGDNKMVRHVNKADIAFHAQRALQELSFDTFKSIKAQQRYFHMIMLIIQNYLGQILLV